MDDEWGYPPGNFHMHLMQLTWLPSPSYRTSHIYSPKDVEFAYIHHGFGGVSFIMPGEGIFMDYYYHHHHHHHQLHHQLYLRYWISHEYTLKNPIKITHKWIRKSHMPCQRSRTPRHISLRIRQGANPLRVAGEVATVGTHLVKLPGFDSRATIDQKNDV